MIENNFGEIEFALNCCFLLHRGGGVMVMLAGQVLGSAVFCVLKSQHIKINSTR